MPKYQIGDRLHCCYRDFNQVAAIFGERYVLLAEWNNQYYVWPVWEADEKFSHINTMVQAGVSYRFRKTKHIRTIVSVGDDHIEYETCDGSGARYITSVNRVAWRYENWQPLHTRNAEEQAP